MRARLVGEQALLVECASDAEVAATYAALVRRRGEHGATEIVPAARTVLLDGLAEAELTLRLVADWAISSGPAETDTPGPEVEIPVVYDGDDLDEVARQWDLSTAEVVAVHTATRFTVAFCGFAPGFAYCTGLGPGRVVRRRRSPRTTVPAGSVALGGEYTGVYPTASPGGWQLIGRTSAPLWDPRGVRPALLTPGTVVRFTDD